MNYRLGKRRSVKGLSIVVWLIIINAVISTIAFVLFAISEKYLNYLALKPSSILQGKFLWTLGTHMFVHGGPFHLLINMFVLFSLGGLIEKIIGRKRFLWFYLASGLFAGILSVLLAGFLGSADPNFIGTRIFGSSEIFMVGASGAIFAIAGLYMMLLPKLRFMIIFLPFFSLPGYVMIPLVLFGVWIVTAIFGLPVGNVAHFGGFISGISFGWYLRTKYKRKIEMLQRMFR